MAPEPLGKAGLCSMAGGHGGATVAVSSHMRHWKERLSCARSLRHAHSHAAGLGTGDGDHAGDGDQVGDGCGLGDGLPDGCGLGEGVGNAGAEGAGEGEPCGSPSCLQLTPSCQPQRRPCLSSTEAPPPPAGQGWALSQRTCSCRSFRCCCCCSGVLLASSDASAVGALAALTLQLRPSAQPHSRPSVSVTDTDEPV